MVFLCYEKGDEGCCCGIFSRKLYLLEVVLCIEYRYDCQNNCFYVVVSHETLVAT